LDGWATSMLTGPMRSTSDEATPKSSMADFVGVAQAPPSAWAETRERGGVL
jgi:hypothetical protein